MSRITRWILHDAGLKDRAAVRLITGPPKRLRYFGFIGWLIVLSCYLATVIPTPHTLQIIGTPPIKPVSVPYLFIILTQIFISAITFSNALNTLSNQRVKNRWSLIRTSPNGAASLIRSAWAAAVYYRLRRPILVFIYAPRVVALLFLLWDLTAFRGEYLIMIGSTAAPPLPLMLDYPLMALFILAAFVLPLSAIGLEAATALLFSTFTTSRTVISIIQFASILIRIGVAIFVLSLVSIRSTGEATTDWVAFLLHGAAIDHGISLLNIDSIHTLWANVPYMAYFGLAMFGVAALYSGLSALILRWAAHRAQYI